MDQAMVYCPEIDANHIGESIRMKLISSTEVVRILHVTQATLYKWIWFKKIKVHRYKIGNRTYNGFDPKEIDRVKSLMVPKRHPGKSILKGKE